MDEKPKDRKDNHPKEKKEPRAKPKETPEAPAPAADAVTARNEALLEEDEKDTFAPLTPRQSYQPTSRRQSRASPRNSLAPVEKVKCYFCGKEGHMARGYHPVQGDNPVDPSSKHGALRGTEV